MPDIQFPMLASGLTNTMSQSPEQQQLEQMFSALKQQIQSQPAPQMEQVPNAPSPTQAFIAQLLGNVGSALAWNPQYSAQTERAIGGVQEAHAGAEQRNLQRSNAYDLQKQSAFLDLALKRLDLGISNAKSAKDFDLQKQLEQMRNETAARQHEIDFQHSLAEIDRRQQGDMEQERLRQAAEDRRAAMVDKRERDRMAQEAKDKANGGKGTDPFSLKDLTAAEARVGNKFGGKVTEKGKGPLGIGGPFGTKQVLEENPNKAEGLREVYVNGALSGGSASPAAARKLGILIQKSEGITDGDVMENRLKELGLDGNLLTLAMQAANFGKDEPADKKKK